MIQHLINGQPRVILHSLFKQEYLLLPFITTHTSALPETCRAAPVYFTNIIPLPIPGSEKQIFRVPVQHILRHSRLATMDLSEPEWQVLTHPLAVKNFIAMIPLPIPGQEKRISLVMDEIVQLVSRSEIMAISAQELIPAEIMSRTFGNTIRQRISGYR